MAPKPSHLRLGAWPGNNSCALSVSWRAFASNSATLCSEVVFRGILADGPQWPPLSDCNFGQSKQCPRMSFSRHRRHNQRPQVTHLAQGGKGLNESGKLVSALVTCCNVRWQLAHSVGCAVETMSASSTWYEPPSGEAAPTLSAYHFTLSWRVAKQSVQRTWSLTWHQLQTFALQHMHMIKP